MRVVKQPLLWIANIWKLKSSIVKRIRRIECTCPKIPIWNKCKFRQRIDGVAHEIQRMHTKDGSISNANRAQTFHTNVNANQDRKRAQRIRLLGQQESHLHLFSHSFSIHSILDDCDATRLRSHCVESSVVGTASSEDTCRASFKYRWLEISWLADCEWKWFNKSTILQNYREAPIRWYLIVWEERQSFQFLFSESTFD